MPDLRRTLSIALLVAGCQGGFAATSHHSESADAADAPDGASDTDASDGATSPADGASPDGSQPDASSSDAGDAGQPDASDQDSGPCMAEGHQCGERGACCGDLQCVTNTDEPPFKRCAPIGSDGGQCVLPGWPASPVNPCCEGTQHLADDFCGDDDAGPCIEMGATLPSPDTTVPCCGELILAWIPHEDAFECIAYSEDAPTTRCNPGEDWTTSTQRACQCDFLTCTGDKWCDSDNRCVPIPPDGGPVGTLCEVNADCARGEKCWYVPYASVKTCYTCTLSGELHIDGGPQCCLGLFPDGHCY